MSLHGFLQSFKVTRSFVVVSVLALRILLEIAQTEGMTALMMWVGISGPLMMSKLAGSKFLLLL